MKTSKPVLQPSAQEECGVWLDTVELKAKAKAKQKRVARPISKLLNPFIEGRGYSLAVALNFTQTKIEMPKTKQTSISTFFAPQQRVLNEMSSSDASARSTSSSTSADPIPIASGTKRRRDTDGQMSDFYDSEDQKENAAVNHEWICKNVTEPEATVWQDRDETSYSPPQNVYCEFEEEQSEKIKLPERKRRLIETLLFPDDSQPVPQAWSQDPLLICDSQFDLTNQKYTTAGDINDSEPSFLNSLQSEQAFVTRMDLDGKTSTQKSYKHFHTSQIDAENIYSGLFSSNSPSKHSRLSHLSNHKWTEPKTPSPRKNSRDYRRKTADEEESLDSQFKWTKPSSSPLKKRAMKKQGREVDEDSLAMLFTQDSQGFRVIAHHGPQTRSPLKDQSNISTWTAKRSCAYKPVFEEEEEDEMLFTQDSQGNMVIKH